MRIIIAKTFSTPFINDRLAKLEAMSEGNWMSMITCDWDELKFLRTLKTEDEKQQAVIQRYLPQCGDWYYQNDPRDWQCAA